MYRKKKSHDDSAVALGEERFGWRRPALHNVQPEMASRISHRQRDTDLLLTTCQQSMMSTFTMREAFRGVLSLMVGWKQPAWRTEPWKLSGVSRWVSTTKATLFLRATG